MLALHFRGLLGSDSRVGPADFFRIEGRVMRGGPAGDPMAHYTAQRLWRVGDRHFVRFEPSAPLVVQFEDAEGVQRQRAGPFRRFYGVDGMQYANDEAFVRFEPAVGLWQDCEAGRFWRALILHPA